VDETLLGALVRGAGIPDVHLRKGLTPETMEAIGKLLREAVQGTLDLLRARGLMKSEMRADVTMIGPLDNNPLKFTPTVEAALAHLLAPQVRGFLPPLRAMKDAYDDLRAHQLGILAGMRAALEEVLARFAPDTLARHLSDPTALDSLLPINRKAKLCEIGDHGRERAASVCGRDRNGARGCEDGDGGSVRVGGRPGQVDRHDPGSRHYSCGKDRMMESSRITRYSSPAT